MQRIGFVGIGLMGRQMGQRLLTAGFALQVWNRTKEKAGELLQAGAQWGDSPAACARTADVVISMVTDSSASEQVICGRNGVLAGAHPGLILVDMASIAPEMSRSLAAKAAAKGVTMLDAPVTGNPKVAADGKLGIMVGGPKQAYDACLPVFQAMGVKIIHVGENGKGTTLKLINNLILGWRSRPWPRPGARRQGRNRSGKSTGNHLRGGARTGAMETRGARMIGHDFSPHFSANNMYKDLAQVMQLAGEVGAFLPATGIALEMLRAVKNQGKGEMDSCSVITVIEAMANTAVKTGA